MASEKRLATLFLRAIPRDVKDAFKSKCALRGVSMQEQLVHYMREFAKGQRNENAGLAKNV